MTPMENLHFETTYQRFRDDLQALRLFLADPHWTPARAGYLCEVLAELREDLFRHYDFLDQMGYFEEVEGWAPHLHERLRQLHEEQFDLVAAIDELHADLAQMQPAAVNLAVGRVLHLLDRIEEHEQKKNKLVVESLYYDQVAMD
jgi:hypothetical protein